MTNKTRYYNVDDYMKQKRRQKVDVRIPPRANFLAAVNYVRNLFENKKFTYAVMGGLEMLCLGHSREMPDVQVAYDYKDFHRIKAKLEGDRRVWLPEGMNSLFPAKCLIRTGPAYKDEGCIQAADIEVDLVPPGCYGAPPNRSLAHNLILLRLEYGGITESYPGLNMQYLVKTLVQYCGIRDLAWDPRKDILFLCQHHGEAIQSIRSQLDQKTVQENFLGTVYFSRLPPDDRRKCYQILLGTAPPPIMAVTPPPSSSGQRYSAPVSEITVRPQIPSQVANATLKSRYSPELLSPQLPGQPRAPRPRASEGASPSLELSISPETRLLDSSDVSTTTKGSRSRYRPVSAPNTRETSPTASRKSNHQTMHVRQFSQPLMILSQTPQFAQAHHGSVYQQQQSQLAASVLAAQGRRSMLNPSAGIAGPVSPFPFPQQPLLDGVDTHSQQVPNCNMQTQPLAASAPMNPGQQHMKFQAGLGGYHPLRQHPVKNLPITERPVPPQARASQPQYKIGEPVIPAAVAEVNRFPDFYPDRTRDFKLRSKPNLSKPPLLDGTVALHSSSDSLSPQDQYVQVNATIPVSGSPAPVELDAMSELGKLIAELSVESTTMPGQGDGPQFQQQNKTQLPSFPEVQGSPVSLPNSEHRLQHQDIHVQPLNPRTNSTAHAGLPASLMVGGSASRQGSSSGGDVIPPPTAPTQMALPSTNASRYYRYHDTATPPSSTPASPQPTQGAKYKAYQPPLPSPSLPLSPPVMPMSPPAIPDSSPKSPRPTSFTSIRDIDGANGYFRVHKRDASNDSSRSQDSSRLALEYQAELPGYGEGYGSPGRVLG